MATSYTYSEAQVTAVQLTATNYAEILDLLGGDVKKGLLAECTANWNSDTSSYDFTFRYKSNSVVSKLTLGDYLVALNAGVFKVMTATEFESAYSVSGDDSSN